MTRLYAFAFAALAFLPAAGCIDPEVEANRRVAGGDAVRGRQVTGWYGCGSCHLIPFVANASGLIGPALHGVARRPYLAGALPNTAENMIRWIRDPRQVHEKTLMPGGFVSDEDARHIAAFLYTLDRPPSVFTFNLGARK